MNLREALAGARERLSASGSDEAGIEAEVLLRHALGVTRATLLASLAQRLSAADMGAFENLVVRRLAGEPLAYITGSREFYGLEFEVTPATLIPRPETEMLVEAVIKLALPLEAPRIADVGAGSGAIAVAVALALPRASVFATDISGAAIDVARRNAARHGAAARISFRRGDLLTPLDRPVDVIAANLPYVTEADWQALPASIREYEPRQALASGADGLDAIRALLRQAPSYLAPGGAVVLEFGIGQARAIEAAARAALPRAAVEIRADFAAIPRLLVARLPVFVKYRANS